MLVLQYEFVYPVIEAQILPFCSYLMPYQKLTQQLKNTRSSKVLQSIPLSYDVIHAIQNVRLNLKPETSV